MSGVRIVEHPTAEELEVTKKDGWATMMVLLEYENGDQQHHAMNYHTYKTHIVTEKLLDAGAKFEDLEEYGELKYESGVEHGESLHDAV